MTVFVAIQYVWDGGVLRSLMTPVFTDRILASQRIDHWKRYHKDGYKYIYRIQVQELEDTAPVTPQELVNAFRG